MPDPWPKPSKAKGGEGGRLGQAPDEEGDGDGGDAEAETDGDTEPLPDPWPAKMPVDKVRAKISGMISDAANAADTVTKTKGDIHQKMAEYQGAKGAEEPEPEPEPEKEKDEKSEDDKEEDDSADEPNPWPVEMPVDEARSKMKGLIDDAEGAAMASDKQKGKMMKVIKSGSKKLEKFLNKFMKTRMSKLDAAQKKVAGAQKKEEKIDAKIAKEKLRLSKGKGKGKGKKGKGKAGEKGKGKGDGKEEEEEKNEEAEGAQKAAGSGAGSGKKGKGKQKCKCEKKGKGKKKKKESPMVKKLKGKLAAAKEKERQAKEEPELLVPIPEVPKTSNKVERDAFGFSPKCLACKAACEEDPGCNAMCYVKNHDDSPCP